MKNRVMNTARVIVINANDTRFVNNREKFISRGFLDLAIVVGATEDGMYALIDKTKLIDVDATETEIYNRAFENTRNTFTITPMGKLLMGSNTDGTENDMYVCTNKDCQVGASILLFPDEFKPLADRFATDLYILPSSIHEVLAVCASVFDNVDELRQMVREVNANEVSENDRLGESIYKYNRETNSITFA